MKINANAVIRIWVAIGLLAYVALPWYAPADGAWLGAMSQIFGGPDTANGISQAMVHGRKWVLVGAMGLMLAMIAIGQLRRRNHALTLIAGGALGALALLVTGPLAREGGALQGVIPQRFAEAMAAQPGMGMGAWFVFAVLCVLAGLGAQRLRAE